MVGHGVITSTRENPFFRIARSMSLSRTRGFATVSRATKDAPAPAASATMSKFGSKEPYGAVEARLPAGVLGEACPPVMP